MRVKILEGIDDGDFVDKECVRVEDHDADAQLGGFDNCDHRVLFLQFQVEGPVLTGHYFFGVWDSVGHTCSVFVSVPLEMRDVQWRERARRIHL